MHAAHLAAVPLPLSPEGLARHVFGVDSGDAQCVTLSRLGGNQLVAAGREQHVAEEHVRVDHGDHQLLGDEADLPQLALADDPAELQVEQREQVRAEFAVTPRELAVLLIAQRTSCPHGLEDAVAGPAVQGARLFLDPGQPQQQEVP